MTDRACQEEIAAASAYEDLHVPALFQQWAARVAEEQIQHILQEAEHDLAGYVTDDGAVEFGAPAHIASGTKP